MNVSALFEAVQVPESQMFCHPSRLANIYEPGVERVIQDSIVIPPQEVSIYITKSILPKLGQIRQTSIKEKLGYVVERSLAGPTINLGERLVYDTRYMYNDNMAHLVQHHLTALGFIKDKLGFGKKDIVVLFEKRIPDIAKEVMAILGYEVFSTNLAVSCNVINVQVDHGNFFHLLPYVNQLEISLWNDNTPEKVFISRKHTRRIKNEVEVEKLLHSQGYEKVYFEEETILNQWSMMRRASEVVAIHGAALGCLAFVTCGSNTRTALVELFGPALVANCFRKYMAILNGYWVGCRGRISAEVARDIDRPEKFKVHAYKDFEISPRAVEAAIQYVHKGDEGF